MILRPEVSRKTNGFIRTLQIFIVNIFLELGLANYLVGSFMKIYIDKVPRDNGAFGIGGGVSMLYKFIVVAIKNIFAFGLD